MQLVLQDIHKSFGDKKVLQGVSFEANSGQALGILGRNGAGKTTCIRIIMGVFNADSGQVLVDGKAIKHNELRIGYMPEERGLYLNVLVQDQLQYFAELKGLSGNEAKASSAYWLEKLEMQEYAKKKLTTLSKGNQQKIQLAATLVSNPDIIILDEPFSGFDPVNAMLLENIVKEEIAKNKLVLFSSHQMNYIEEFCENIAILNGGNIVLNGAIKAIKKSYSRLKLIIDSNDNNKIAQNIGFASHMENNNLAIMLNSQSDKPALLKKLSELDVDIDEIRVFEPSLSDIFVEYTEDSI